MPYLIDLETEYMHLKADYAFVMKNGGLWAVIKFKLQNFGVEAEAINQLPKRRQPPNGFSLQRDFDQGEISGLNGG
jgi:hypothetical protein